MWITAHYDGEPILINLQNVLEIKQIGKGCIVIFENSNMLIDESLACIIGAIQNDRHNYIYHLSPMDGLLAKVVKAK